MREALSRLFDREISKGAMIVFIARFLGMGLFLVFNLMISNLYGPETFGDFTLWIMALNLGGLVCLFGMDSYILQQFPAMLANHETAKIKSLDFQIQKFLIGSILFGAGGFYLLSKFYTSYFLDSTSFLLLALILGPFVIFRYRLENLRARKDMISYALIAFVSIPAIALSLILIFTNLKNLEILSLQTPVRIYSVSVFIASLITMIVWQKKKFTITKSVAPFVSLGKIMQSSLAFMLVAVLMFFNEWVDKFMLKVLSDSTQVGLYSSAYRIVQLAALPLISINAIAAPKFAASFKNDNKKSFNKLVSSTTRLIILFSIPLLGIIFLVPEFLLGLFGEEFVAAKTTLLILMVAQCINIFAGPVGILLKMTEKQNILLNIVALAVVLNIALNLILIPIYGLVGAGISTAASIIIINIAALFYIKKTFGFYTFQEIHE